MPAVFNATTTKTLGRCRTASWAAVAFVAVVVQSHEVPAQTMAASTRYTGACDASAAVALGNSLFVVANDEDNRLRVYLADHAGDPVRVDDVLYEHLGIEPDAKKSEADIEGAAWLGDRIYWITSHGRDGEGKQRPNRLQFFATTIEITEQGITVQPVGRAYTELLDDRQPGKKTVPELAPKDAGLNIEGLAATSDGDLLIGIRNPRPDTKALVLRLKNPAAVIDTDARAKFGKPLLLDLGGLGVRSIEYDRSRDAYWIIAGSHTEEGSFALYRWSGAQATAPVRSMTIADLRPEALIVYPERTAIQLLSDDGILPVHDRVNCTKPPADGMCECKDLKPNAQGFRSAWVTLE